ncbi:Glycosyltransferase family 92 protein [Caenorhabditis elegans]|uniref:Glycosyltransferase family 92 protein n=1 Tax=Caenorhabditis elegans TaxID=6239 RepID=O02317_CAEEL|nr:Glycosyltransferase family 92 protein [Caenorhabditis elegans]CAB05623.1 Glycosyltransferase family 92 protein [Caenorhabditis elegans]|eukprot:NP_493141.1 Uncharacterized protein CELE_T15D6.10 [Caenorhabditis elegans]
MEHEGLLGGFKNDEPKSANRNSRYQIVIAVLALLLISAWSQINNSKISTNDAYGIGGLLPDFISNLYADKQEDLLFAYKSSDCPYEEWNQLTTTELSRKKEIHDEYFRKMDFEHFHPFLYHTKPSAMSAFAHKDQIVVTLTSENMMHATMYCRYYDCRRREISVPFKSAIFHKSTVFCARRPNAKYIAISATANEIPEYSIPIVPRIEKPPHYFTVCMAPLYGDEAKFLQIVDFIEYHKLQGATFFHIYLRNVSDYDRMLLDEYVKTGDIEIIKMHDHFWRADYMWHDAQINDCHHRSKYFSKWTAFIDIDERLEMNGAQFKTVVDYLDTFHTASIANLHFRVKWVMKHNNTPERYENDKQLTSEMLFHKYQNLSRIGKVWQQPKCIIRPENVAFMTIHQPLTMYKGEKDTIVDENIGFIRHYRNIQQRVFRESPDGMVNAMMSHGPYSIQPIDQWIEKNLTENILSRVKLVYDIVDVTCDQKKKMYDVEQVTAPCTIGKQDLFTKQ